MSTWCQARGARSTRLGVVEDNARAVRFWQTMGFGEFDRRPFQRHRSKDHTAIVIRRHLTDVTASISSACSDDGSTG